MKTDKLSPDKLLSIDWDYVTGDCADEQEDFAHAHCGYCTSRSISKVRGQKNYLDTTWEEKEERLLRLRMYKGTPLFVAECHANIMDLLELFEGVPDVFDYDAHHDKYDDEPYVHCGNWIYHLDNLGGEVFSRPRLVHKVGAVFVCHSSPWTPRCMDEAFFRFIKKMSDKTEADPQFIGHRKVSLRNGYQKING